jgi:hypothetical protein
MEISFGSLLGSSAQYINIKVQARYKMVANTIAMLTLHGCSQTM